MGTNVTCLRALNMAARLYGVDFSKTVMLGRSVNRFTDSEFRKSSVVLSHDRTVSISAVTSKNFFGCWAPLTFSR